LPEKSTHKLIALIEAIPLPAALIGANQRITCVNDGFRALFGEDTEGRHFITAIRQPAVIEAIEAVLQGGLPTASTYLGREATRETTFDVRVKGVEADVLITFSDRTEVETVGRMRSDFIANVSHELRTPLTALMGFIETLRGAARNDAAARERFLQIMEQEAGRMTRLVDELMTLSRLEGTERTRPTDIVAVDAVLLAAKAGLEPIARNADVTLTVTIPSEPVLIRGDFTQLQQVFTNLIENALKYGAKGKRIDVTLHAPSHQPLLRGTGVVVSVQDYGEGIAAHHIPRLTERFYRVDSHRSRSVGGTGLGLAIVKHIINRHRGRLKVESDTGEGAKFSVILPE